MPYLHEILEKVHCGNDDYFLFTLHQDIQMREFTREETSIFTQILAAKYPMINIKRVIFLRESTRSSLAKLILEHLVETWERGPDCFVTLTPLGAEVLNVTLVEPNETLPPEYSSPKQKKNAEEYPCCGQKTQWDYRNPNTGFALNEPRFSLMPKRTRKVRDEFYAYVPPKKAAPKQQYVEIDGKQVRVFAGSNGEGYTIPIDSRIGGHKTSVR